MDKKQWKAITERLASIPEGTPRVVPATGSYIGEGFDDSRLDTLFLTQRALARAHCSQNCDDRITENTRMHPIANSRAGGLEPTANK